MKKIAIVLMTFLLVVFTVLVSCNNSPAVEELNNEVTLSFGYDNGATKGTGLISSGVKYDVNYWTISFDNPNGKIVRVGDKAATSLTDVLTSDYRAAFQPDPQWKVQIKGYTTSTDQYCIYDSGEVNLNVKADSTVEVESGKGSFASNKVTIKVSYAEEGINNPASVKFNTPTDRVGKDTTFKYYYTSKTDGTFTEITSEAKIPSGTYWFKVDEVFIDGIESMLYSSAMSKSIVVKGGQVITLDADMSSNTLEVSFDEADDPNVYTVNFYSGDTLLKTEKYTSGYYITEPAEIKCTNGWFKNKEFTEQWNFTEDTVSGNTNLYTKWIVTEAIDLSTGIIPANCGITWDSSSRVLTLDNVTMYLTSDSDSTFCIKIPEGTSVNDVTTIKLIGTNKITAENTVEVEEVAGILSNCSLVIEGDSSDTSSLEIKAGNSTYVNSYGIKVRFDKLEGDESLTIRNLKLISKAGKGYTGSWDGRRSVGIYSGGYITIEDSNVRALTDDACYGYGIYRNCRLTIKNSIVEANKGYTTETTSMGIYGYSDETSGSQGTTEIDNSTVEAWSYCSINTTKAISHGYAFEGCNDLTLENNSTLKLHKDGDYGSGMMFSFCSGKDYPAEGISITIDSTSKIESDGEVKVKGYGKCEDLIPTNGERSELKDETVTFTPTDLTMTITQKELKAFTYLKPTYKTSSDATSGIEKWTTEACTEFSRVEAGRSAVTWNAGWYVVYGSANITGTITCSGAVNLILADGVSLNATKGIKVSGEGNSLTIYAQSTGTDMGSLTATGTENTAGIGGGNFGAGSNITINGGTVKATGGAYAAGIGGGNRKQGSYITINDGTVTATAGVLAAAIGGGYKGAGSYIVINGGTVNAKGDQKWDASGSGIGGGCEGNGSEITINSGTVTAIGAESGSGIGGGYNGAGSYIAINGGTVSVTGGAKASGIGGGYQGSGGNIEINGGTVTATGGDKGAGIGGGSSGSGSNITINGGTVKANGSSGGAGIGGGNGNNGSNITINGGTVTATGAEYKTYGNSSGIGGGFQGSGSKIYAADNLTVKAGANSASTPISHTSTTDLSTIGDFKGKRYCKVEPQPPQP